jgi:hypothetical protein
VLVLLCLASSTTQHMSGFTHAVACHIFPPFSGCVVVHSVDRHVSDTVHGRGLHFLTAAAGPASHLLRSQWSLGAPPLLYLRRLVIYRVRQLGPDPFSCAAELGTPRYMDSRPCLPVFGCSRLAISRGTWAGLQLGNGFLHSAWDCSGELEGSLGPPHHANSNVPPDTDSEVAQNCPEPPGLGWGPSSVTSHGALALGC